MDGLTAFVAISHLKLRLEYLGRHPEILKGADMTEDLADRSRLAEPAASWGRESAPPSAMLIPSVNLTKDATMTTPVPGSFAASLRAMMDEARAGVQKARSDGLLKVGEAVGKLNEAKTATEKVAGNMAQTIEDEAAAVLSELGQISNSLGGENG